MSDNEKTILVVEDERALADALKVKLEREGLKVVAVNDGEEAKRLLETDGFGLVLTDLMMPKFSGFDLLELLQKKGDKTPVVVLSNLSQTADIDRVKKLGGVDYLVKSDVSLAEVVERVKKLI